ncbi:MAG: beta-lactamase family protein [Asgard group archaeon]|nr:beta-lactamase family protein [Asgard group archaeon]
MTVVTSEIIEELRKEIKNILINDNIPGLAISIVDNKETLWLECFGYSDPKSKTKVTPDTIFSIQSIGKTFTAIGFMRAVSKGMISLDDKLINYYPDFTVNSRYGDPEIEKITFRHLLAHYAGFTHRTKIGGEYDQSTPTFEEYNRSISDTWLKYPVGDRYLYSNLGMSLVAYALEKISNMSFPDFIRKEICDPLNIHSLAYGKEASEKNSNRAIGYTSRYPTEYSNIIFYGAGGQFLSVKDMSRFVRFLLNEGKIDGKQYIRKDLLDEMIKEQFTSHESNFYYGLGVEVDKKVKNLEILRHSGGGYGYNALIAWIKKYNIGVVVLANQSPSDKAVKVGYKALNLLLTHMGFDKASTEAITPSTFIQKPKTTLDVQIFKKFEGLYTISGGKFEFKINNNQPTVIYQGNPLPLYSHSETEFTADIPIAVRFILSNNKKPIGADVLLPEGVVHRFHFQGKIKPETFGPNKDQWKKYEGIYQAMCLGDPIYFAIKIDNGHLKIFLNNVGELLEEYKENIFFTNDARAVIFEKDQFYYDNIRFTLLDKPIDIIRKLLDQNPKHRFLSKNKLKELYFNLKYLNRTKEMEEIGKVIYQLFPEEKIKDN